jgi:exopolyphosphatase / guanosine-5'-triphosphate,3'-diphosphate pyrophosphatase
VALPSLLKTPWDRANVRSISSTETQAPPTQAIIDIGSNSVRLVVYAGPERAPSVIFNEKVMAALGRSLETTGEIDSQAMERGLLALRRFHGLAQQLSDRPPICVATAAVRDAKNGAEFLNKAQAIGLSVRLLSGEEEAAASGYGVLSGIPDANGIVADLGGGSLELVRIGPDGIGQRFSMPLGVLRLPNLLDGQKNGPLDVQKMIRAGLAKAGWGDADLGLPLYLVGGSWRSLARLDMHLAGDPLPVMHLHAMPDGVVARLQSALDTMDGAALKTVPGLSGTRIPQLPHAAKLLAILEQELSATALIISSTGLREGLLYQDLPNDIRQQDPLLVAAREEGRRLARFPEHGKLIDRWIAPLFPSEGPQDVRLRQAACMLADIAWSANPGFRAERGVEVALHGSWLGATMVDRYRMAQSLFTAFGGGTGAFSPQAMEILAAQQLRRATKWGLAIRLGQRLSGGVAEPLRYSRLVRHDMHITLHLARSMAALDGEAVRKRLRHLGMFMDCSFEIQTD